MGRAGIEHAADAIGCQLPPGGKGFAGLAVQEAAALCCGHLKLGRETVGSARESRS